MGAPASPLYSCLVPVHNGIDLVDRCLESIFAQTEQSYEVIVVDDASTDGSLERLRQWAAGHPGRLHVLSSADSRPRGIAATYRLGASFAQGRYLAFLEQDDAWDRHFLASKTRLFAADADGDVGVIFSPYRVVREGFYGIDMILRRWLLGLELPRLVPFDNHRTLLRTNNVTCFSAFVCRRELWGLIPGPPDGRLLYFDWWVLAHLSLLGQFLYDPGSHVHWRCSPLTTLGRQSFRDHRSELAAFLLALYASLEKETCCLGAARREAFLRHQSVLPLQLRLLQHCGAGAILQGLIRSPDWTLRMLASLVVNRLKKAG